MTELTYAEAIKFVIRNGGLAALHCKNHPLAGGVESRPVVFTVNSDGNLESHHRDIYLKMTDTATADKVAAINKVYQYLNDCNFLGVDDYYSYLIENKLEYSDTCHRY